MMRTTRPTGSTLLLLLALALAMLPHPAAVADGAADHARPRVSRQQWMELLREVDLPKDRQMIVEFLYTDYASAIDQIIRDADAAAEAAGRSQIDAALAGRVRLTAAELRERRAAVLEAYRAMWPAIDEAREGLVQGLAVLLLPEDQPAFEQALRALARKTLLHPLHDNRHAYDYAGEGVDVLVLLDEAMRSGSELESFDPGPLTTIIENYELQLDAILRQTWQAERADHFEAQTARVLRDTERLRAAQQRLMQHWQQRYDLNAWAVDAIAGVVARELSPAAADDWRARFRAACFPWLVRDRKPDRQFEWLMKHDLPAEMSTALSDRYDTYVDQRDQLAEQAIALMLSARRTRGVPLHAMIDAREVPSELQADYQSLLRNSGELSTLDADTSRAFESIVDDQLRTEMRRTIR